MNIMMSRFLFLSCLVEVHAKGPAFLLTSSGNQQWPMPPPPRSSTGRHPVPFHTGTSVSPSNFIMVGPSPLRMPYTSGFSSGDGSRVSSIGNILTGSPYRGRQVTAEHLPPHGSELEGGLSSAITSLGAGATFPSDMGSRYRGGERGPVLPAAWAAAAALNRRRVGKMKKRVARVRKAQVAGKHEGGSLGGHGKHGNSGLGPKNDLQMGMSSDNPSTTAAADDHLHQEDVASIPSTSCTSEKWRGSTTAFRAGKEKTTTSTSPPSSPSSGSRLVSAHQLHPGQVTGGGFANDLFQQEGPHGQGDQHRTNHTNKHTAEDTIDAMDTVEMTIETTEEDHNYEYDGDEQPMRAHRVSKAVVPEPRAVRAPLSRYPGGGGHSGYIPNRKAKMPVVQEDAVFDEEQQQDALSPSPSSSMMKRSSSLSSASSSKKAPTTTGPWSASAQVTKHHGDYAPPERSAQWLPLSLLQVPPPSPAHSRSPSRGPSESNSPTSP
ncbi:unnamed protein product [Amoebophrya sp. A25]|nr:unnamed protein product [Amoebophrya sp. A25]|eukprot:GSA25T00023225001.1